MSASVEMQIQKVIEEFFKRSKDWSLFSFLKYREGAGNFTYEKDKEHMLYKKALESLSENDEVRKWIRKFEVKYQLITG